MADDSEASDDLEARIDRLESTLEELRDEVMDDDRIEAGRQAVQPAAETALRLTERLAVPAAVAALEANVRVLTFVQDRLRELEDREGREEDVLAGPTRVSERALERLDDALERFDEAIAESDLPQNAEARRLLERARELNDDVRERVSDAAPAASDQDVVTIDVEEELDQIRDDVDAEDSDEG